MRATMFVSLESKKWATQVIGKVRLDAAIEHAFIVAAPGYNILAVTRELPGIADIDACRQRIDAMDHVEQVWYYPSS